MSIRDNNLAWKELDPSEVVVGDIVMSGDKACRVSRIEKGHSRFVFHVDGARPVQTVAFKLIEVFR